MSQDGEIRFTNVRFGEVSVPPDRIITFPNGLPGFERCRQFAIVEDEESVPFCWMLSVENPRLAFVLLDPFLTWPEYHPRISRDDLKSLGIEDPKDTLLYVIVTLSKNPGDVTANLSGPLLINATGRTAKQLALIDDRYTTKHRILQGDK
jgi:flagellar assembly factor FliW